MIVVYDADFLKKLKKIGVRIKKSFKEQMLIFSINPNDSCLNNHSLKNEYQGCRSINITSDWRAVYKETRVENKRVAYFLELGTHKQLYRKSKVD